MTTSAERIENVFSPQLEQSIETQTQVDQSKYFSTSSIDLDLEQDAVTVTGRSQDSQKPSRMLSVRSLDTQGLVNMDRQMVTPPPSNNGEPRVPSPPDRQNHSISSPGSRKSRKSENKKRFASNQTTEEPFQCQSRHSFVPSSCSSSLALASASIIENVYPQYNSFADPMATNPSEKQQETMTMNFSNQQTSDGSSNGQPSSLESVSMSEVTHPYPLRSTPVYPVSNETWVTYMNSIVEFSDGSGRETAYFLRSFDEVVEMFSTSADATKVYWFGIKLTGLARVWFDSLKDESRGKLSWLTLREQFILMYGEDERKVIDILVDIKGTKQNVIAGESVRHLVIKLADLFSEYFQLTGVQLAEQDKCKYFIGGLTKRLRPFLVSHYQTLKATMITPTLMELVKQTYQMEASLKQPELFC